jgi:alpha,alpha-trehalase
VLIIVLVTGFASAQVTRRREAVPILEYIKQTWHTLTRTNRDLASAAVDPKYYPLPDGRWPIYVSREADLREIEKRLEQEMAPADRRKV